MEKYCASCDEKQMITHKYDKMRNLFMELGVSQINTICDECLLQMFEDNIYSQDQFNCSCCGKEINMEKEFFSFKLIYICSDCVMELKKEDL